MSLKYTILLVLIIGVFWKLGECLDVKTYSLLMPNVNPKVSDSYLCTSVRMGDKKSYFITGFLPNATMATAHHVLLYGCKKPGSSRPVWNCREMSKDSASNDLPTASPCLNGSQIIYAWAKDAPRFILPENVGIKVGGDSSIQYLVLQVHYANVDPFKNGRTDDSGVHLQYTSQLMPNQAGVYLMWTLGRILPKSTEKMEAACLLTENKKIYPFAYRVHTHSLGVVVSGYVIKPNKEWIKIGKMDPQKPQMFYKILDNRTISQNDTLAIRCTMKSNRNQTTYVGYTNNDEMCVFYLMYYVKDGELLEDKYCFTNGPPSYSWKTSGLINIPDKEASTPVKYFP